jgi:fatty-acyl-CoA synthase
MINISQILRQSYLEVPDQLAVYLLHSHQPEQALTYRTLIHRSGSYARALQSAKIQPGEVVILILQHREDLISAFFGAVLCGAIPSIMPFLTEKLLPDQYRASLMALLEISTPAAIITYDQFHEDVENASKGASVRAIFTPASIQDHSQITPEDHGMESLSGLSRSPDEIALLQHSSGTTGLQKGVALSHRAVFNQLDSYARALDLRLEDVIVSWLPLYHDMGLIAGFIMPILKRIPLVLLSPFDWVRAPQRLLQAVSDYRGTLSWMPNFAYNFCAQKIRSRQLEDVDLSSWRAVINCSEPMYWSSHKLFLDRFQPYGLHPQALATSYAMAENVFAVTQGGIHEPVRVDTIDREAFATQQIARPLTAKELEIGGLSSDNTVINKQAVRMLSAGRPIAGTSLQVLDPQGKELPERRIGEIALQSNCMLTGYYHRPDLTADAFLDGWYLTGDLGYIADGELYVTGRKKDLIIVGGKNVYPQDLERLAGEVEGIHPGRVAAFGLFNDQIGTEEVVIVAEADLDANAPPQVEKERIAAQIRQKVTRGSDVALRFVQIVDRNWLIKTSSGKVARSANRDKYLAEWFSNYNKI